MSRTLLVFGALFYFSIRMAEAFSLSPMTISFSPSGRDATRSFIVENNGAERLAIQISMVERHMAPRDSIITWCLPKLVKLALQFHPIVILGHAASTSRHLRGGS